VRAPALCFRVIKAAVQLARVIQRERIQIVLTSTVLVLSAALAAKATLRPHLWLVQEILGRSSRPLAFLVRALSTRIVCVSQASAKSIGNLNSRRTTVEYPGVEPHVGNPTAAAQIRAEFGVNVGAILIAHVARLHYWKGQDYFIKALHELKQRGGAEFRAVIVGEVYAGYEPLRDYLLEQVRGFNLTGHVMFAGHRNDAGAIFEAADVTVSPATAPEPFGLVIAEAMAAGKPVIATCLGAPAEIIIDGECGILIPPNDPSLFADKLQLLIENPALRARIGEAARRQIETRFPAADFNRTLANSVLSMLPFPRIQIPTVAARGSG